MAISQEQQECAQRHLRNIRRKMYPAHSVAAEWWDKLMPEWRGVVLYAAAVTSGAGQFPASLSNYCWAELYERLDYKAMFQLRQGISRARQTFAGFGTLCDADFSRRTANRPIKNSAPVQGKHGVQMVVAPQFVHQMLKQQEEQQ